MVRGFEEDYTIRCDSLTVGKGTLRIFLMFAVVNNWTENHRYKVSFSAWQKSREMFVLNPQKKVTVPLELYGNSNMDFMTLKMEPDNSTRV